MSVTPPKIIAALVADIEHHLAGVRRLLPSRADARAAEALRTALEALIRDAQQLEGIVADAAGDVPEDSTAAYDSLMVRIHDGGDRDVEGV